MPPELTDNDHVSIPQSISSADSGPGLIGTVATSLDASADAIEPYFTGGVKDVSEYFIDLDNLSLRPGDYPLDVQAYFECVGRFANDLPNGIGAPVKDGRPYTPDQNMMTQGLAMLRQQRNTRGIWVNPRDVTAKDMEDHPSFPWLGPLLRKHTELRSLVLDIQSPWPRGRRHGHFIILGNVRLAFPRDVGGPRNPHWLAITGMAYGYAHPLITAAYHPWFKDGHMRARIRARAGGLGCDDVRKLPREPPNPDEVLDPEYSGYSDGDESESSSSGWSTA